MVSRHKGLRGIKRRIQDALDADDIRKSAVMFRLERRHQRDIREIIKPNGLTTRIQAKQLGISQATLVQWRQLFNIRSSPVGRPPK